MGDNTSGAADGTGRGGATHSRGRGAAGRCWSAAPSPAPRTPRRGSRCLRGTENSRQTRISDLPSSNCIERASLRGKNLTYTNIIASLSSLSRARFPENITMQGMGKTHKNISRRPPHYAITQRVLPPDALGFPQAEGSIAAPHWDNGGLRSSRALGPKHRAKPPPGCERGTKVQDCFVTYLLHRSAGPTVGRGG